MGPATGWATPGVPHALSGVPCIGGSGTGPAAAPAASGPGGGGGVCGDAIADAAPAGVSRGGEGTAPAASAPSRSGEGVARRDASESNTCDGLSGVPGTAALSVSPSPRSIMRATTLVTDS